MNQFSPDFFSLNDLLRTFNASVTSASPDRAWPRRGAARKRKGTLMNAAKLLTILLIPLMLAACQNREQGGTVLGAVAGGLLGSTIGKGGGKVAATAAGVVVGGLVGNSIGRKLDEEDRRAAEEAEYRALEYGESGSSTPWRGREGHSGAIIVEKPYRQNEEHCRRYTHTVIIDGRPEKIRGTACRGEGGRWHAVT